MSEWKPMPKWKWRVHMVLGWLALKAFVRIPIGWAPSWLISAAGFYGYDDGYENYVERCQSFRVVPPPEAKP